MSRGYRRTALLIALALAGCAGTTTEVRTDTSCNPTDATILGDWARPEVHYVDAQGTASPASGWRAELWLPDDAHGQGCRFSCASSYLSAVLTAAGPATFVQLEHRTEGARRLSGSDATLSVGGADPVARTTMRTERFEPYQVTAHHHSYMFAFPPTNPTTWEYLEAIIAIEGSSDRLRVRFVRSDREL